MSDMNVPLSRHGSSWSSYYTQHPSQGPPVTHAGRAKLASP